MKILCLFVRHGTARYPEALGILDRWYESHGLLSARTLWILDNQLPPDAAPQTIAPATVLRPGDNTAWEFSAWDRARREAEPALQQDTILHCVTSAFNTLYTGYLNHFHPEMLNYVLVHNACLGHIDYYDAPVQLAGQISNAWIRTCFFFLGATAARHTGPWAVFADSARFFTAPETTQFRADAPICAAYRERIHTWLEGGEIGGHTWHSPIGSGDNEARRFQQKALAILNEHHLTLALRAASIALVDFCWLHEQWRDPVPPAAPPPVSCQLQTRRRLLGMPELQ